MIAVQGLHPTLLFVKYVTDKAKSDPNSLIEVSKDGSFDDMLALKGDKEIGDKINRSSASSPNPMISRRSSTWPTSTTRRSSARSITDERHGDFVRLVERLDPRGAFRNQWLQSRVLGNA
jgi:hypothetical protein